MSSLRFHDDHIFVGDSVYDINRGRGIVIQVATNVFEVEFKNVRIFYTFEGKQNGKVIQTLFWDKPFIIPPKKNAESAELTKRKFDSILALLKNFEK